jgi:hypothetical protein
MGKDKKEYSRRVERRQEKELKNTKHFIYLFIYYLMSLSVSLVIQC